MTRLDVIAPDVSEALERMDGRARRAFATSLCHRQRPVYVDFSDEYDFGDPDVFADTTDLLGDLDGGEPHERIESLRARCREAAPDSDEWGTYRAHAAQQTISVLYAVIQWLRSDVLNDLKRAAEYAIENADYIDEYSGDREHKYEVVDPNRVPDRPLAIQERARQARDATDLLDERPARGDRFASLRKRWGGSERADALVSIGH